MRSYSSVKWFISNETTFILIYSKVLNKFRSSTWLVRLLSDSKHICMKYVSRKGNNNNKTHSTTTVEWEKPIADNTKKNSSYFTLWLLLENSIDQAVYEQRPKKGIIPIFYKRFRCIRFSHILFIAPTIIEYKNTLNKFIY